MSKTDNKKTGEALAQLLADTYTLAVKTQNFHWNVTGPDFSALHALFETQYNALSLAVDAVAERMRALNLRAPGSLKAFLETTTVQEAKGGESSKEMLTQLADDNEKASKSAESLLAAAQESEDAVTEDLAVERMAEHQKAAWMLRTSAGR